MALVLCRGCQRHVKRGEAVCPFCGTAQSSERVLGRALGSAMLLGVGLAVASCGGEFAPEDDAGTTVDSGSVTPLYGPVPAYGPPPDAGNSDSGTVDAGTDAGKSDAAIDAGPIAAYGPVPMYGPVPAYAATPAS